MKQQPMSSFISNGPSLPALELKYRLGSLGVSASSRFEQDMSLEARLKLYQALPRTILTLLNRKFSVGNYRNVLPSSSCVNSALRAVVASSARTQVSFFSIINYIWLFFGRCLRLGLRSFFLNYSP